MTLINGKEGVKKSLMKIDFELQNIAVDYGYIKVARMCSVTYFPNVLNNVNFVVEFFHIT